LIANISGINATHATRNASAYYFDATDLGLRDPIKASMQQTQ